ncbi:hypothetical protein M422DRAFT_269086 [Sphaerobolus stellatus SS14]|uniref:Uncharacterized protein n=1 Tax=Sphaerobolus stellatus (strain SS14) TaxID=990650 RepID=A0A0C9TIQ9_SPHS4|nr:hypothetical protein M422DRAFT_269086 [Sphaerobolus stellatus SS14]
MSAEASETVGIRRHVVRERSADEKTDPEARKAAEGRVQVLDRVVVHLRAVLLTDVPTADRAVVICSLHLSYAGTRDTLLLAHLNPLGTMIEATSTSSSVRIRLPQQRRHVLVLRDTPRRACGYSCTEFNTEGPSPHSSNPYSPSSSAPYNLLRPLLLRVIAPPILHNDLLIVLLHLTHTFLFDPNSFTLAKQAAQSGGKSSRNLHEPQTRFRGGAFGVVKSLVVIICGIGSRRKPEKGEAYDAVDCLNGLAQRYAGGKVVIPEEFWDEPGLRKVLEEEEKGKKSQMRRSGKAAASMFGDLVDDLGPPMSTLAVCHSCNPTSFSDCMNADPPPHQTRLRASTLLFSPSSSLHPASQRTSSCASQMTSSGPYTSSTARATMRLFRLYRRSDVGKPGPTQAHLRLFGCNQCLVSAATKS